jgi:TM2 domain-containing membrane protein YozV
MHEVCPHCGKVSNEESPRFCSGCGARMDGTIPAGYPEYPAPSRLQKNQTTAGFCSTCLPGLGQVYNGETGKGFAIFLFTIIGLVLFIVPGLIIWLYAMYDSYSVAGKMNTGEIPFRETRMLHMVLFIGLAVIVIVIALVVIIAMVMAALMDQLRPLGITDINQLFDTGGLF